jgi:hypothetical protein
VPLLELIVRNIVRYPQSATSTPIRYQPRYQPAIYYLLPCSGDTGDLSHGDGGGAVSGAATPRERERSAPRTQATGAGACAWVEVGPILLFEDATQGSTPLQSLTSRPWRSPGGGGAAQSPFEVSDPLSSPSPILSSHSPVSSGVGGNPSDSLRITAKGRTEFKARLPRRDHPDTDLGARLVHIKKHSIDVGVYREVKVRWSEKSALNLPVVAPLAVLPSILSLVYLGR